MCSCLQEGAKVYVIRYRISNLAIASLDIVGNYTLNDTLESAPVIPLISVFLLSLALSSCLPVLSPL